MKPWLVFALLLGLLSGCRQVQAPENPPNERPPEPRPPDFSLVYEWSEGSLPPPYHYEYSIRIGEDGAGEVRMLPDYEYSNPPEWVEAFHVTPEQLDEFYQSAWSAGLFATRWETEEDPPVGGSSESLLVTAAGKKYQIPWYVPPEQQAAVETIIHAVNDLVPADLWQTLEARRQAYMQSHPDD